MITLARLFHNDNQLDAAEEAASCAISLLSEKDEPYQACKCHRTLGTVYHSKGNTEEAIHHLEVARGIASSFSWPNQLFWARLGLADLLSDRGRFDDAYAHIEHAKLHAISNHDTYLLARAVRSRAEVLRREHGFEEARSEALCAGGMYEKLGAAKDMDNNWVLLKQIDSVLKQRDSCELGKKSETLPYRLSILRVLTGS